MGDETAGSAPIELRHVSDVVDPGHVRIRKGRGFAYRGPDGSRLADGDAIARIKALGIPPAWTDVWICADPLGHIQATGRDARGRKQYRYHEHWLNEQNLAKFARLGDFASALPRLRRKVDDDIRLRGLPREKVLALVVMLLDRTMIRIGNPAYARDNGSYGLATLRNEHVEIGTGRLRFSFVGKSGKAWRLSLTDPRIARIVRQVHDLPGQSLFQYVDEDGDPHPVSSGDVNDYIREASRQTFTAKSFRTWGGSVTAATLFAEAPPPDSVRARLREANRIIDQVASRLNNTRAVCRERYIHPAVVEAWEAGDFNGTYAELRRSTRERTHFDREEAVFLRFLENAA